MKPLPTGSPAAGEPGGECYSRSPHISRSCQCFPLATGSQRAREPSRSNPQRSACWGAKQAEKAQSRYRGANKICGTLAVSSFGQAQAPKPGESVLHTRCGPEVSASILQFEKRPTVCFSGHHHGNHSAMPSRPRSREWWKVTFSITCPFHSQFSFLPPQPQSDFPCCSHSQGLFLPEQWTVALGGGCRALGQEQTMLGREGMGRK